MKTKETLTFSQDNYVAIMAGGIECRFWPMSRSNYPKQFLDLLNTGESLLQATLRRFAGVVPAENIYVITAQEYLPIVLKQLPELPLENVLGEPERKNTAACITYICTKLYKKNPKANLIIAPSDHMIGDEGLFRTTCSKALRFSEKYAVFLALGIKPTYPNPGYGYIQMGSDIVGYDYVKEASQFIEKPSRKSAELFLADGQYLWNTGIVSCKAKVMLDALKEFQPSLIKLFEKYGAAINTSEEEKAIGVIYKKCASISIDYAVMENATNTYVLPSSFQWNDLGTWNSAWENFDKDEYSNAVNNDNTLMVDSSGCIVHSTDQKLLVVGGVEDLIIVNTPDALLVCKKTDEKKIKEYLSVVEKQKGKIYS